MKTPSDEDIMEVFNGLNPFGKPEDKKREAVEKALRELKSLNGKMGN